MSRDYAGGCEKFVKDQALENLDSGMKNPVQ